MLQTQSQSSLPFFPDDASAAGRAARAELLRRSPPLDAGAWDELRQADGQMRARWRDFFDRLPASPPDGSLADDLDRRVAQVARQIRHDGITHNVFGAEGAAQRPWPLELLPLIIEPADWAVIEQGVVQRANMLEAMLADVYGPQQLLHEGLFPPALLLRHRGYLRSMCGVAPASGQRLHIVAFDLVRTPRGVWQVVARRTQGPSGLGYVLHNRLVISRQFPDAFRELRVQHIASSYRRLLDSIESPARAVAGGGTPRVVLLTPGPYSETYFEHAYLARYLGLPLVEGGDLVVREMRLYLKTVEGLEPVHGMLRRLDDEWCDPLELRVDSALGVPGLLQAVRAGHLVMANALGSGFLETPALLGFLPGIAQRLLGQELLLPSLPTWWCGEAAAWHDVKGQLHDKVVRSTFPSGGRVSAVRHPDAAQVEDDPDAWTLTERLQYSRAPVWSAGTAMARSAMVRVYVISEGNGRWFVLPGGMTRVAKLDDSSVSMQRGGSSLDTWVLTDGPVDSFSMLPSRLGVDDIAARRPPVSSRTAENLFWLGRYTERTEQLVRLARAVLMLIDTDNDAPEDLREALSELAVSSGLAPLGAPTLNQAPHLFERALLAALADPGASSIAFNLRCIGAFGAGVARAAVHRTMGRRAFDGRELRQPAHRTGRQPAHAAAGTAGAGPPGGAAGGRHRRADRPHDARSWLALPHRGPAARAADRHELAARHFRRHRRAAPRRRHGTGAGAVRQRHHLSRALPAPRRPARADRPAGAGQCQPTVAGRRAAAPAHRAAQAARRRRVRRPVAVAAARRRAPACSWTRCAVPTSRTSCACWPRSAQRLVPCGKSLADDIGHRFFAHASASDELQRV